ncbi:BON1-associated protein 2-like [Quillaja saponaria]|uniref:BON1-associated protein 2-like n=1 Tax=Quillaja saponaria TaxID=32244 RepID=A0AAD7P7N6_QUISA|nr:BON1-associated protein 2-like [Quillaja saponaria]
MFKQSDHHQPLILEITVLSAQGLKKSAFSTLFSRRIRPFITLTMLPGQPPNTYSPNNDDKQSHVYKSRVDDQGGINPTWGDKFRIPVDTAFFANRYSSVYLQLYTKRLFVGQAQIGWCLIPATDVGLLPAGSVRHLSYRLRDRDGSRGNGVINLAVKLQGFCSVVNHWIPSSASAPADACQTVIGLPVTAIQRGESDWLR